MTQQRPPRESREMSNWPRRCSVSKIKGGFQDRLAFFFFFCLPLFSFTEGATPTERSFQDVKIFFVAFLGAREPFLEKSLAGVLPPWLGQFRDFFTVVSFSF